MLSKLCSPCFYVCWFNRTLSIHITYLLEHDQNRNIYQNKNAFSNIHCPKHFELLKNDRKIDIIKGLKVWKENHPNLFSMNCNCINIFSLKEIELKSTNCDCIKQSWPGFFLEKRLIFCLLITAVILINPL